MNDVLPSVVETYLGNLLRDRARPLVLDFDHDWQLCEIHGDAEHFGIDTTQPENSIAMLQDLFIGMPIDERADVPFVELGNGQHAHVHLIPEGEILHVLLLDASEEFQRQQMLQQAGNEAALANHNKTRAIVNLRRIREQLERQQARLEEANALKSALIATLSHDFRTPLTAIFGHLHLLEQQHAVDSPSARALRVIRRSAMYLSTLAENLLEYGRGEAGGGLVNPVSIDLVELARDLRGMFAPLADAKSLQFSVELESSEQRLPQLDEVKLKQILINLLSNAVRYTEHGKITAHISWRDNVLTIEIGDSGIGIPEEFRERIFQPFNHGAQHGSKGAGLGLSIVKRLVQQMHGELRMESEVGCGTRFHISLPSVTAAPLAVSYADTSARHRQRGLRVLIVDDDPDVADLLAALLEDFGFVVTMANQVAPDLAQIFLEAPDLLLMDVELPGISGNDAVQRLRAQGYAGRIVTLSANATERARKVAMAAGCDDFLTKPLNVEQFLGTIQRVVATA
ncbi:response regulator [Pseudolysobacter antarcticus]|uniref:histidine kinase n=1 Tax=Pseudolysobacter antarcticus TaxID=2511995 RepID=A0A411HMP9_9GAMM|nr:hybrid sensor histidine kinase/response regulator [Pseudolysobacter antarcticus]QBB71755.1 response regulator [Pseudolysobacter antarcticus]